MKSTTLTCITELILFAAFVMPVWSPAQQQNQKHIRYTVTDLGTLGGTFSTAQGISEEGWVAGWSLLPGDQTQHSFLWVEGLTTDFGTLGGRTAVGTREDISGLIVEVKFPVLGKQQLLIQGGLGAHFHLRLSFAFPSFGKTA